MSMGTNQGDQHTVALGSGQPHNQHNGWSTRAEKLVRYWQEECRLYAWIYEQNVTYYSRLNRTLGIASIALSAITGTTLFNQSASEPDSTSSGILIGLGVSSIASTILSGLKELLDLNTLITQNTNAARENSSIVMDIDEQLNMDRADRIDGREFLKSIKDRKNALIQNGPIIPSRQWKQVHKKIQSKEQLGFLNRDVFNEYLEQSVDINKLQFGSNTTTNNGMSSITSSGEQDNLLDHGTPSSITNSIDSKIHSVTIDIPQEHQSQQLQSHLNSINEHKYLNKRAGLQEKIVFYGGARLQILPTAPMEPTPDDLKALQKEIENVQPRCAARKAILENQYELERLLSKTGELKGKDRQQITNLRNKARNYREAYQKFVNDVIGDCNSIINSDCARIARLIRAYRDGHLSENELFRAIQMDLIEIDNETFQYETRLQDLIARTLARIETTRAKADELATQKDASAYQQRYPFRQDYNTYTAPVNDTQGDINTCHDPSSDNGKFNSMSFNQFDDIENKLWELTCIKQLLDTEIKELQAEYIKLSDKLDNITPNTNTENDMTLLKSEISNIETRTNELLSEKEMVTQEINELLRALAANDSTSASVSYARLQSVPVGTHIKLDTRQMVSNAAQPTQFKSDNSSTNPTNNTNSTNNTNPTNNPNNTSHTTNNTGNNTTSTNNFSRPRPPSTVPSDDEFIENMMGDNLCAKQLQDMIKPIVIPSIGPTSPNGDSSSKSPKRRPSKYEAQMRYQTARIN